MSTPYYVDTTKEEATALHCQDCDDENEGQCFWEGKTQMAVHQHAYEDHSRIVWLKPESEGVASEGRRKGNPGRE